MRWTTPLSLLCLLTSCVSSPVPQPVPFYIRTSTPEGEEVKQTLVVGLPGAVIGKGRVHIRNLESGASSVVDASGEGSFVGVVAADHRSQIDLRFENEDGLSEPVPLLSERGGLGPQLMPSASFYQVVSPPDAQGLVTVSNDGGPGQPPVIWATPGSDVIVSNASTGLVALGRTDSQGVFSLRLAGQTGDAIHIMLSDPENPELTSGFFTETVP